MTDYQIDEMLRQSPKREKEDKDAFWRRLLKSLRLEVKPGKKFYLGIKGKAEF